jgi:hypothetical protein
VIEAIREHGSYFDFAYEMSQAHTQSLQNQPLDGATQAQTRAKCAQVAARSEARQTPMTLPKGSRFEDFVGAYYA